MSRAWEAVPQDIIQRGFEACGWSVQRDKAKLHVPLRSLLVLAEAAGDGDGASGRDGGGDDAAGWDEIIYRVEDEDPEAPGPSVVNGSVNNPTEDPTDDITPYLGGPIPFRVPSSDSDDD